MVKKKKGLKFCDLLKEDNLLTKKKEITKAPFPFVDCWGAGPFSGVLDCDLEKKKVFDTDQQQPHFEANTKLMNCYSGSHPYS